MSTITKKRRVKIKIKQPNPLFEKWLQEWKSEAAAKGSKLQYAFGKALKSLKKYPLPLKTGKECGILEGFGDRLCIMLDRKLVDYRKTNLIDLNDNGVLLNNDVPVNNLPSVKKKKKVEENEKVQKRNSKSTEYIPKNRSGAYAILVAMYEKSKETNYIGYMLKSELVKHAQQYADKSFTKPEPDTKYTAWSSMGQLVSKELVRKVGAPAKFSLSDKGLELGKKLTDMYKSNEVEENYYLTQNNPSTSMDTVVDNGQINIDEPCFDFIYQPPSPIRDTSFESLECEKLIKNNEFIDLTEDSDNENIDIGICNLEKPNETIENMNIDSDNENIDIGKCNLEKPNETIENMNIDDNNIDCDLGLFDIVLKPNSYEIILLVDTQETAGTKRHAEDDITINTLKQFKVNFEVRHLNIGDFLWICRNKEGQELVLPYIIERKRMDDLAKSIKDGRFHEQKFRLKQCGVQNIIYLVEGHGLNKNFGLPISTLYQASTNTFVQDKFSVKYTNNHKHSMEYISVFTEVLKNIYQLKTLTGCTKETIINSDIKDDIIPLLHFNDFNKGASKSNSLKIRDLFIKQLLQLKGLSVEKALAITSVYPTPQALRQVYLNESDIPREKLLSLIRFGPQKRCIGPIISKLIYQLYTKNNF